MQLQSAPPFIRLSITEYIRFLHIYSAAPVHAMPSDNTINLSLAATYPSCTVRQLCNQLQFEVVPHRICGKVRTAADFVPEAWRIILTLRNMGLTEQTQDG
jgi:hypothetical protein